MNIKIRIALILIIITSAQIGASSIGLKDRAWKNGAPRVCWTNDGERFAKEVASLGIRPGKIAFPSQEQSEHVKQLISETFSKRKNGIEFVGFENCTPDSDVEILLVNDMSLKNIGSIATSGDYTSNVSTVNKIESFITRVKKKSGLALNRTFVSSEINKIQADLRTALNTRISPESRGRADLERIIKTFNADISSDLINLNIIHEFGHLTGLLHEERRRDFTTEQPRYCFETYGILTRADDYTLEGASPNTEDRLGTDYDPFSVMNYCRKTAQILYRKSILMCGMGDELRRGRIRYGQSTQSLDNLLVHCDFIKSNPLKVELSPRDQSALRALYLNVKPAPGVNTSYKSSPVESTWVQVLNLTSQVIF